MASSIDKMFWAFIFYVKHNPFKSIDNMTENDFDAMVSAFSAVNDTQGLTPSTAPDLADYYGYGIYDFSTDTYYPKKGVAGVRWATDENGVDCAATFLLNEVAIKSASYPEEHLGE